MSSNKNVVLDNSQATLDSLSFKQEQDVDVVPVLMSLMIIIILVITALLVAKKRGVNLVKKYLQRTESRWELIEKKRLTPDTSIIVVRERDREIVIVESKSNIQVVDNQLKASERINESMH
ncbi:hypothetical protein [Photobacterium kasasachensis]|uniref:hypothetical protein n=1 Tax=Photobacterium kasasachensis TaxID=2910240 RepID=UPI003D1209D3